MSKGIGFIIGFGLVIGLLNTPLDGDPRSWFSKPRPDTAPQGEWQPNPTASSTAAPPALPAIPRPMPAQAEDPAQPAAATAPLVPPAAAIAPAAALTPSGATRAEPTKPQATEPSPDSKDAPSWQPVWQPFRSELSARGFAQHLVEATGATYRVTRYGGWSYQVELAYTSGQGLRTDLEAAENAIGIRLRGKRP